MIEDDNGELSLIRTASLAVGYDTESSCYADPDSGFGQSFSTEEADSAVLSIPTDISINDSVDDSMTRGLNPSTSTSTDSSFSSLPVRTSRASMSSEDDRPRPYKLKPGSSGSFWVAVLLFTIINFCADSVAGAGRAVSGQFLNLLGADSFQVGIAAGFSAFAGYGTKAILAFFAEKAGVHWWFVFAGYALMSGVAFLGLVPGWLVC